LLTCYYCWHVIIVDMLL